MAARTAHEPVSQETPKKPGLRRRNASLHVSSIDLLKDLQYAQLPPLTKLETNDTADATMNLRRHAAKRGNVRPDFWRGMPVVSRLMVQRNRLLGRRTFLGLGAALTGAALGARPGRAETLASPPADAPWSQSIGAGVVDRPYGRPADG